MIEHICTECAAKDKDIKMLREQIDILRKQVIKLTGERKLSEWHFNSIPPAEKPPEDTL